MKRKTLVQSRGSMLIIALVIACILGILAASLIGFQGNHYRQNISTVYRAKALFLAESGIQRALYELNYVSDLSGLVQVLDESDNPIVGSYSLTIADIGDIDIMVEASELFDGDYFTNDVVIESTGSIEAVGRGKTYSRKIRVIASKDGNPGILWPGAISSLTTLELKEGVTVDSFKKNADGSAVKDAVSGDILAYCNGDVIIKGSTIVKNNTKVYGDIIMDSNEFGAGAVVNIMPGGKVYSYYDGDGDGVITEVDTTLLPHVDTNYYDSTIAYPVIFEDVQLGDIRVPHALKIMGGTVATDGGVLASGTYTVDGNNAFNTAVTLTGGDYKFETLTMGNNTPIEITGDTRIYVTGDLTLGNGAEFIITQSVGGAEVQPKVTIFVDGDAIFRQGVDANADSYTDPAKFRIFGTGETGTINIANGAMWSACIYAPNYNVQINQGGEIYGAISADYAEPKSAFEMHYDETLEDMDGEEFEAFVITTWSEMKL